MKSMKQEKQQEIALMRYGAIAPIIAGLDERYPSKTAFYTEISAKGLMGPDGKLHHYAPATIEKWYLDYQNHGFEGLVPKGRSDAGMSRKLDEELQERIRYFKTNYPRMSAAAIYRQLKSDGSVINGQVSESTVSRFVKRLELSIFSWNCGRHRTRICAAMNALISMRSGAGTAASVPALQIRMAKNTGSISLP